LLKGTWPQVLLMSGFAAVSAVALASWVIGYGWGRLGIGLRWLCLLAAGMMVVRTISLQIVGLILYVVLMVYAAWAARKARDGGPRLVIAG